MAAVERVLKYAKQPLEEPWETVAKLRPVDEWPQCGKIEFNNFSLKKKRMIKGGAEEGEEEGSVLEDINLVIRDKVRIKEDALNNFGLYFDTIFSL